MKGLFKKHYIYLYYFRRTVNVGDIISPYVVSKVSGYSIKYKNPKYPFSVKDLVKYVLRRPNYLSIYLPPFQKCLMAVGSVLDFSNKRCVVWGTGFREYDSIWSGGDVYAVRGYLTKKKLPQEYKDAAIGDPAILLPLLLPISRSSCYERYKIGIVPHYMDIDDLNNRYSTRYKIIDVRTNDIEFFVKQIVACDYILSSSLHGLIIAHSYGIPALWISNNYTGSGFFKFHDYFSSVDIHIYDGFKNIDEILKDEESYKSLFNNNTGRSLPQLSISVLQKKLIEAFPDSFKNVRQGY